MSSTPIFIVGFTGAGKTTYGQKLANELELPFIDLDALITKREGKTIAEIFAEVGDEGFRKLERDVLHAIPLSPAVVACGGGMPCFYDNMDWMNAHGKTIYLQCSVGTLLERLLQTDLSQRPLLAGKSKEELKEWIEKTLEERKGFYERAKEVKLP